LKKTLEKLQKLKAEAYEKMNRRVVFTDLNLLGFEDEAVMIPQVELHLDQNQEKAI
jgi:hypothetical protein